MVHFGSTMARKNLRKGYEKLGSIANMRGSRTKSGLVQSVQLGRVNPVLHKAASVHGCTYSLGSTTLAVRCLGSSGMPRRWNVQKSLKGVMLWRWITPFASRNIPAPPVTVSNESSNVKNGPCTHIILTFQLTQSCQIQLLILIGYL